MSKYWSRWAQRPSFIRSIISTIKSAASCIASMDILVSFGITEDSGDVLFVIASNFSGPPNCCGYKGSVSIFELDVRQFWNHSNTTQGTAKVFKIVDVPQAQLLDGLALINQSFWRSFGKWRRANRHFLLDLRSGAASHCGIGWPTLWRHLERGHCGTGSRGHKRHEVLLWGYIFLEHRQGALRHDFHRSCYWTAHRQTLPTCKLWDLRRWIQHRSFGDQFISQGTRGVLN